MKCRIIVSNKIKCKKCGNIIESKYTHDFKSCSCDSCSVDGGLDYLIRCGNPEDWEDLSECKFVDVKPKYNIGDIVTFSSFPFFSELKGRVVVVDTYPNSTTINYDVILLDGSHLYKNIDEKDITSKCS